ncbi:MAG: imidazolonepropionase [Firmicutes bacterium]|nr:imidazolonepropionase [Bacillota bacterium]
MVVLNAGQLLTVSGQSRPRAGRAMRDLGIIEDGYFASLEGVIVDAGPQREFERRVEPLPGATVIDAKGGVVSPGFVDPHTHLVFAGWRAGEFAMRIEGRTYLEIHKAGGGINSTVESTRASDEPTLLSRALERLDECLKWGTTTVEVKSGYGLDTGNELKCLRVVSKAAQVHPAGVVGTFMGLHAVPPEFAGNADGYVDLIVNEMLPAVQQQGVARFADVFCEKGVFTPGQSRRVLVEAGRRGMRAKVHADELAPSGGAELAAEVGAISAEHLMMASDRGLEAMRGAGCVAVLLPGTPFFLGGHAYAPARRMIDMGLPVALGTDFNPGSCTLQVMPVAMTIACTQMRMTPEECFTAATVNAACATGIGDRVGRIERGMAADAVVFDAGDYREIPYRFAANLATCVIKSGRVVARDGVPCWSADGRA